MKPISLDLRQRILSAYQQGEGSYAELARRFSVGKATVERLLRGHRKTGSLLPGQSPGRPRQLSDKEREQLRQWIDEQPDLTQDELRQRFEEETGRRVSARTMGRARAALGMTRKKSP